MIFILMWFCGLIIGVFCFVVEVFDYVVGQVLEIQFDGVGVELVCVVDVQGEGDFVVIVVQGGESLQFFEGLEGIVDEVYLQVMGLIECVVCCEVLVE